MADKVTGRLSCGCILGTCSFHNVVENMNKKSGGAAMENFLYREISLKSDKWNIVATRTRNSKGVCAISIKFAGMQITFEGDEYLEQAREAAMLLSAVCDDPCDIPGEVTLVVPKGAPIGRPGPGELINRKLPDAISNQFVDTPENVDRVSPAPLEHRGDSIKWDALESLNNPNGPPKPGS